jgi:hypothetical protein
MNNMIGKKFKFGLLKNKAKAYPSHYDASGKL